MFTISRQPSEVLNGVRFCTSSVRSLFGPALTKVVAKATPQKLKYELELDSSLYICMYMTPYSFCLALIYTLCIPLFVFPSILISSTFHLLTNHHLLFNTYITVIIFLIYSSLYASVWQIAKI